MRLPRLRPVYTVLAVLLSSCQQSPKTQPDSTSSEPDSTPVESGEHTAPQDSTPYGVGDCPPYSGLDVVKNPYELKENFLVTTPPYQATELDWNGRGERSELGDFVIELSSNTNELSPDVLVVPPPYTTRTYLSGWIDVRCNEDGYWERGRTVTWVLEDLFDRFEVTTTTIVTWDPPILVIPADLEPGMSWTINSTQTTQYESGAIATEIIDETRTALRIETIQWDAGHNETDALLVESTSWHQLWYHVDYGLVRGDGLTLMGGGYGIDDTE